MRAMLFVGLATAALSLAPSVSEAAALSQLNMDVPSGMTLVAGGCGPGGFRAANGLCYRRPPPRAYHRRACPPRYHLTRFGCRPNF